MWRIKNNDSRFVGKWKSKQLCGLTEIRITVNVLWTLVKSRNSSQHTKNLDYRHVAESNAQLIVTKRDPVTSMPSQTGEWRLRRSNLTCRSLAVWTKQDWSVSFSTSCAYPTRPLFSSMPWYSSTWVRRRSTRRFLHCSMDRSISVFLSWRVSNRRSKCSLAHLSASCPFSCIQNKIVGQQSCCHHANTLTLTTI